MVKLRFALVGCGRIGNRHLEHILNLGELAAICDIDQTKLDAIAINNVVPQFTSLQDLLDSDLDFDVVSVCTPNGLHAQQSIACFNKAKHVLCEKPMALNSADCRLMIDAANANEVKLFVIKQNRFNPPIQALKQLITDGTLGKLYSVQLNCFWNRDENYYCNSWKGTKLLDGGSLFTQFSHFVDLLYWLVGNVVDVQAYCANFGHQGVIEFEDTGVVILKFENNVLGTINFTVNSCKKNMEGSITIFGEKGTVKVGGEYLNALEYQQIEDFTVPDLPMGNKPNNYGTYQGSMSNHNLVYENVIQVLQANGVMTTLAEEGLKTVEIIEKIYNAAASNQ